MLKFSLNRRNGVFIIALVLSLIKLSPTNAQTLAFPGAQGFGCYAKGARGAASQEVYVVTNLNDSGTGSFRDAVSKSGRIVVFAVGGIVKLSSDVSVAANVTIAGQTAPGDGIVFFNKRVTFSGASNTICRYLRIRLGATGNSGNDASGLANGANMIFDHTSFSWGMDEVFSINWDGKGSAPDNITLQNCIIGQGLFRENHSAGGLIQTPDGGKVSLLQNLYISNKTRNPKVKGVNEFVNNVVYDWGNGNRLDTNYNYGWAGDAYIMGGSAGVSEVNIINNYFMGGPLTPPSKTTPFSRGTGTFNLYGAGNYFDNNKNGLMDGTLVPYDETGYPGIVAEGFQTQPYAYPMASPTLSAQQAYQYVCDNVGANYPRRDQVDNLMIDEVKSYGTKGLYVYRETDLPFSNGGLGDVFSAPAPQDSDNDGMPDAWEDANGLNKNNKADATAFNATYPEYLNIEVYVNSLINTPPPVFIKPPTGVTLSASTFELPSPGSKVVINWKDNSDNEDYFVLERSTDGVSYADVAHPAADATSFTDNDAGLLPNTTYYYRLKAVNASGASSYSSSVSVKTPALPSAPSVAGSPTPANGFQYVELSGGKLTLKWSGSTNTQTYSVYVGTSPDNLVKKTELAYVASPSYQLTDLTDYTTYYWRVDASNTKGTAEGNVWSFRTTKIFPAGLVGHWGFDETDGIHVTDSSTYQDNGILGLDDDDQSIRVLGKINNALDFATANPNMYVVSVPHQDQLYLDKGSFSLSFWMKAPSSLLPPDNNTSAYLLCKGSITRNATTGATGKRFDIEFKNKQIRFAIDDDVTKEELSTDGTSFFTNKWVHVVVMRDTTAKKLRLYRNGTLVTTFSSTKTTGIGEVSDLVIGNIGELEFLTTTNKPAPYKGMLDELKIFNYALSPTEVTELYNAPALYNKASNPMPENEAGKVDYGTVNMSWKGGGETYNLYVGTDAANLTQKATGLTNAAYQLTNVTDLKQYFWRVDAVRNGETITGDVWSFNVTDNVPPTVVTKNISVTLDNSGHASITPEDVDNASSDAYGIAKMEVNQSSFNCSNIGENEIMLTVTDNNNNVDSATAMVTVVGAIPAPAISVSRMDNTFTGGDDHTIYLGYGAQQVTLSATNSTSSGPTQFSWSPADGLNDAVAANPVFAPLQAGDYVFNTTATNEFGCVANASVTIKVIEARCGNNSEKVVVCHNSQSVCVAKEAVPGHLAHGCIIGSCAEDAVATGSIKASAWEEATQKLLAVYPNPSSANCTIEINLDKPGKYRVELYNSLGIIQTVIGKGEAEGRKFISFTFNANNYTPGVYFLKLITETGVYVQRIVLQR